MGTMPMLSSRCWKGGHKAPALQPARIAADPGSEGRVGSGAESRWFFSETCSTSYVRWPLHLRGFPIDIGSTPVATEGYPTLRY